MTIAVVLRDGGGNRGVERSFPAASDAGVKLWGIGIFTFAIFEGRLTVIAIKKLLPAKSSQRYPDPSLRSLYVVNDLVQQWVDCLGSDIEERRSLSA